MVEILLQGSQIQTTLCLHIFSTQAIFLVAFEIFYDKIFNFLCQDLPGVKICQQVIEFRWNFETFENRANSAKMKYLETPKYESLTMILTVKKEVLYHK